jgi:hypothetical protein
VDEFLILSSQGDILYEWQCANVRGRIEFVEFISKRAWQLGQGLALGEFEGFEIQGNRSRILTQIENDHAILVRTKLTPVA